MKRFIYNGQLVNATELAILLAWGSMVNPNACGGDKTVYYSILLALNEIKGA